MVVEQCWSEAYLQGWSAYVLFEKMKLLKSVLKVWSRDIFGGMDAKIQQLTDSIKELDFTNEATDLLPIEMERWKSMLDDLWAILKNKESLAYQRSRVRWINEGDANTKSFHACGSMKLIEEIVGQSDGDKSPGSDGYNLSFFKTY